MHFNIGSAYSAVCQLEKAETHYLSCINFKGNYAPAYLCLGEIYMELNELKKAEETFRQLLEFDQNNIKAHDALLNLREMA